MTVNALVFEAAEQGSMVLAQLVGVINEDNALHERLTSTSGKGVLIDLGKVERINSCGVRDWIRFAQRLEAAGNNLYLLRCSPVVVAQLNMVRNFCGEKGHVVSFQAPYFCPNCDEERTETFESSRLNTDAEPSANCPTCGGKMEFDDLPDLYFAFARIHGGKTVPPEVQTAAARFQDGAGASASTPAAPSVAAPKPGSSGLRPAAPAPASPPAVAPKPGSSGLRAAPASAPQPLTARPASNPALTARPAAPATAPAATAARPSRPELQRPASATAAPGTLPAPAAAPGQPPGTTRPSGPRPAVAASPRPLMGGSPFPARPSGPRPAIQSAPPQASDPTKK